MKNNKTKSGLRVFVYRNLSRRDIVLYSAKDLSTGLVAFRSERILIKDAVLKVSQAGRARVLRDKRKNVHAGVVGTVASKVSATTAMRRVRVSYNPYVNSGFVTPDGETITSAHYVDIGPNGCFAYLTPKFKTSTVAK